MLVECIVAHYLNISKDFRVKNISAKRCSVVKDIICFFVNV